MKRFKYSLESVLNFRESEKEQCRERLSQAERDVREEEIVLKRVSEEIEKARNQTGAVSIEFLVLRERYLIRLRNEEKTHVIRLQQLRDKADAARQELLKASQEVLKMEKVKARELRQWEQEARREEQQILDEAGGTRSFRVAGMLL